jgi:hypothetical protein
MLLRLPYLAAHFAVLVFAFALMAAVPSFGVRLARTSNQVELGTRELSWTAGKGVHRASACVLCNLCGLDSRAQDTARIADRSLLPVGNTKP